jgi:predicted N-formylglutamate amidohydrolase
VEKRLESLRPEASEAQSYRRIEGDARLGLLILCDHAESTVPAPYGTLGLGAEALARHIASDIGIAGVAELLAQALGAPALLTQFSRLLIDPNRGLDDPTLIMQISDGIVVPGNAGIDAAERETRIARYYLPYHRAIEHAVDAGIAAGKPPVLLALHSFTQAWKAVPRPWHVAVLWDKDPRLAQALLDRLREMPGLTVGENVPYSGKLRGDTLYRHGTARGLRHALVELRQDLILDAKGQAEWAERLAHVLRDIIGAPALARRLHSVEHYGSHRDPPPQAAGAERTRDKVESVMDERTRTELEAAAFRRLVAHLREHPETQNIDLMELAGFCRNCLANWYQEAAAAKGLTLSKEAAREIVYGMPYEQWKAKFQTEAPKPLPKRARKA